MRRRPHQKKAQNKNVYMHVFLCDFIVEGKSLHFVERGYLIKKITRKRGRMEEKEINKWEKAETLRILNAFSNNYLIHKDIYFR